MGTEVILGYLSELEKNNNREWYHSHKNELCEAKSEFENLITYLILEIGKFDESVMHLNAKNFTFKLVRDTRASHIFKPICFFYIARYLLYVE